MFAVLGTRPEAIKLAPVIRELRGRPETFDCSIVSTGQHREMVDQALAAFDMHIDIQFDAMASAQSLGSLTARLFTDLDGVLGAKKPDWIIVQGDTTSAMVAATCAFYHDIRVAHVEAGLRTFNKRSPFPEEVNRTLIGDIADLHFCPTNGNRDNLLAAGVSPDCIHVTGNTVVDALLWVRNKMANVAPEGIDGSLLESLEGRRMLLVTSHRRESFGAGLETICRTLLDIVTDHPDVVIVFPVHPNPCVQGPVRRLLGAEPRIRLLEPLGYLPLVYLMERSYLILTDSGGIQEEAPSLGKPLLILRQTTERPEVIDAGCARLVGTTGAEIKSATDELLNSRLAYNAMASVRNPFGDGTAAKRIADILSAS